MVWALFPSDPLSGEEKYYIFAKGTYKVGRKGCDVIITKDKGVSRVHAEIAVDALEHLDQRKKKSSDIDTKVRIRDCSKYGTFITRGDGSKEKVHESPSKEIVLNDGDLLSFGTGNAAYRFCFVPFVFYICYIEGSQGFHSVQDSVLSIGAAVAKKWTDECTHVIVDQFTPVNDDLIDAIVSKKNFASHKWLEYLIKIKIMEKCESIVTGVATGLFMRNKPKNDGPRRIAMLKWTNFSTCLNVLIESRISHEIPNCSSYVPTLTLDGASVAVADNRVRENCLKGYTFILGLAVMYKFSSRLSMILEVGGARTVSLECLDSSSQDLQDESNRIVHVVPAVSISNSHHRGSKLQVNEIDLIRAVISGYLDPSILVSPAIILSSSSTDETIVADSDAETETESATSGQPTDSLEMNRAITYDIQEDTYKDHIAPSYENVQSKKISEGSRVSIEIKENDAPGEHESKVDTPNFAPASENAPSTSFVERHDRAVIKQRVDDGPESGCSEVLYSQTLIMRDMIVTKTATSQPDDKVVNFKRFRKVATQSRNSFVDLVPFAKNPYMNSVYEKEVVRSMEEDKKRRKMEAMAEDLFNSKVNRRGATGSLHTLLTRR